tara:strand:- start:14455 stop:15336 length:882 start_codon:yes stop_codon:yes gene_type:complete
VPAVGFKYPNGNTVSFDDVRAGKVDLIEMGMSLPTLIEMSKERDPNRKPSTTELLTGTCESYLKRTKEFFIDPQDRAFSLAGTMHHSRLERHKDERHLLEQKLEEFNITGIADLYDKETKMLIDYKNTGSYKCAQLLGMTYKLMPDPSGAKYKSSGKWGRKGSPKMVKQWYRNEGLADFGDWGWQLNWYRYLLEKSGYPVDKMYIQVTLRDGGLAVSRDKGLDKNIYLIEVPKYDNEVLENKFLKARDELLKSLDTGNLPQKCSSEETWNGRKCQSYCDVRELCPYNNGSVNG